MSADGEPQRVLLSTEAEVLIENLAVFPLKDIGCPKWQKHHEYTEKLNMQALLSASCQEEEFVKESFISIGKIPSLIEDLITTDVWKKNVFPIIMKTKFKPKSTIPIYMVLYHEATLVNLLETIFFHKESLESADESALDLLDYCYRSLTDVIVSKQEDVSAKASDDVNNLQELKEQSRKMDFDIAVKVISILRYMTDALDCLPLSMTSRMLNTHNIPCLLVELIEHPPWSRTHEGKNEKFIEGKWVEMVGADAYQLTKIEAQAWLAAYNLLMSPECAAKYDFSSFNKAQLLKLRSHLNDVLLDQLPLLVDMRRYLEQLAISESAPPKQDLILEQLPQIRDNLMTTNEGKWKAIAKHQMKNFFNPSQHEMEEQAKRLADTYNFDVMDQLITEVPHCAVCGAEAVKRCSRCRQEWYCKRECQVSHWPKHKAICNVFVSGKATSS